MLCTLSVIGVVQNWYDWESIVVCSTIFVVFGFHVNVYLLCEVGIAGW
jgi:hypothetical protein